MKYNALMAAFFIVLACSIFTSYLAVLTIQIQQPVVQRSLPVEDQMALMRAAKMNAAIGAIKERMEADSISAAVRDTSIKILLVDYVSFVFRHANGTVYANYIVHNLLTNLGATDVVNLIGGTGGTKFGYIEPTNATMSAAITDIYCCGGSDKTFVTTTFLNPAAAAYSNTGTGTGTISAVFTEPASPTTVTVYGAGLTISSSHGVSANNLEAEANLPSTASLSQVGDNVTIVWYITVTAG
jgi:hypothetical protein